MFDIQISYRTGNSLHKYNTEDTLDLPVSTIALAKENLKRIKEYHEYMEWLEERYMRKGEMVAPECYIEKDPFDSYCVNGLSLVTDNGNHVLWYPFWRGNFESLIEARVIVLDEDSLTYTP